MSDVVIIAVLALLAGCIVAPQQTAAGDVLNAYNAQILTFWGIIATGLITVITQVINMVINTRAAKKAAEAIETSKEAIARANHQNDKIIEQQANILKLTQELAETNKKSILTDKQVADTDRHVGMLAETAIARDERSVARHPPVTVNIVNPAPATAATPETAAGTSPVTAMNVETMNVDAKGEITIKKDEK